MLIALVMPHVGMWGCIVASSYLTGQMTLATLGEHAEWNASHRGWFHNALCRVQGGCMCIPGGGDRHPSWRALPLSAQEQGIIDVMSKWNHQHE